MMLCSALEYISFQDRVVLTCLMILCSALEYISFQDHHAILMISIIGVNDMKLDLRQYLFYCIVLLYLENYMFLTYQQCFYSLLFFNHIN